MIVISWLCRTRIYVESVFFCWSPKGYFIVWINTNHRNNLSDVTLEYSDSKTLEKIFIRLSSSEYTDKIKINHYELRKPQWTQLVWKRELLQKGTEYLRQCIWSEFFQTIRSFMNSRLHVQIHNDCILQIKWNSQSICRDKLDNTVYSVVLLLIWHFT